MKLIQKDVLVGHEDRVWSISWHPSGKILASCSGDKSIRLWREEGESWIFLVVFISFLSDDTWNCVAILNDGHKRTIRSISWSPSGEQLASASFDATVCIWEKVNGAWDAVVNLEGHENEVKSVSWSYDGKFLSTCSRDKTVWIWEVMDQHDFECAAVITNHTQDVKRTIWSPKESVCASCSYDNSIRIYKEQDDDWVEVDKLDGHESTVWSIDFNKSGNRLVSVSDDQTIKIWQKDQTGTKFKNITTLSGHHSRVIYDVSWSKLNDHIASCGGDDSICIFSTSVDSGDSNNFDVVTRVSPAYDSDVNCVEWNPSVSNTLASCSDDGTIKIWTLQE